MKQELVVIENRYGLIKCIHQGSTYNIYDVLDRECQGRCLIMKVTQTVGTPQERDLKFLAKLKDAPCVVNLIDQGFFKQKSINYIFQVQDKYGPNLKQLLHLMNWQFSMPTICVIVIKMLTILEVVHKQSIAHRALALDCFLTDLNENRQDLFICNFHYAQRYSTKPVMQRRNSGSDTKINKYSSIGAHLNTQPSPKDDLESVWYMLLNLLYRGTFFKKECKSKKIRNYLERKQSFIPEKSYLVFIDELLQYHRQVMNLNHCDFPLFSYEPLKLPFRNILQKLGIKEKKCSLDWVTHISKSSYDSSKDLSPLLSPSPLRPGSARVLRKGPSSFQMQAHKVHSHELDIIEEASEMQHTAKGMARYATFFAMPTQKKLQVPNPGDCEFENVLKSHETESDDSEDYNEKLNERLETENSIDVRTCDTARQRT